MPRRLIDLIICLVCFAVGFGWFSSFAHSEELRPLQEPTKGAMVKSWCDTLPDTRRVMELFKKATTNGEVTAFFKASDNSCGTVYLMQTPPVAAECEDKPFDTIMDPQAEVMGFYRCIADVAGLKRELFTWSVMHDAQGT